MNRKLNLKNKLFFLTFLISSLLVEAKTITMEEIINLRNQNLITQEEFEIFEKEIKGEALDEEGLYDLNINGKLVSKSYKILNENNKKYFPLKEFFKCINFTNYKVDKSKLVAYLGTSLKEVKIDLNDKNEIIQRNNEIYVEASKFAKLFLSSYDLNINELKLRMYLSFDTPTEIRQLLDISQGKLQEQSEEKEIVFSSKRKFFDLGYARLQLGQSFDKVAGEKSYKSDWDGNIAYQGGFLYGQITADYDLREKELNTVKLEYTDIWKGHNLDIENRRADSKREWGIFFYKDKGFYETAGGQIVIRENVPLGSRAELLYMGTPIEIKDDDNGVVEFDNPLIRTDRTYILRVYQPDGKISEKEIKTVEDYNLQQRNEIEYKLAINEDSNYSKFTTEFEAFYGITSNLTLGIGYFRDIEELAVKKDSSGNYTERAKYLNSLKADIVYGGTYNALSYIFNLSGTKTIDNFDIYNEKNTNPNERISVSKRYTYKYLNQFNYDKWKLIYEHEEFGKFYDEKNRDKVEIKYDIFKNIDIGYLYEIERYRYGQPDEKKSQLTFDADYSWNKFLFSAGTSLDLNDHKNHEYRAGVYYSGWERLTGRLENIWTKNGEEYETKLSLYNNNFGGFIDFTTELSYSKQDKDKLTFKFAIKLDNWLKIDTTLSDDGARNHRIGIDKIVDLKNPRVNLDTMDNSRVKVITFVDKNNNDLYDPDEDIVPGVEVKIGDKVVTTDNKGEGMFYGIGNGILYDMDVSIRKPSFTLGNNKVKVKSNFSSTVDAHIPIKPMLSLNGQVEIDKALNLKGDQRAEFFNDLIIELKDLNGNVIETSAPDNEGIFEISGLFPKDYYIEVTYVGTKYNLKSIREEIELAYSKESSTNTVLLKISNNKIAIDTSNLMKNVAKLN